MRVTRTRDEWRALIEAQQLSGLNQTQFCHHHGITRSAFSNAKLRLPFVNTPPSVFVPALPLKLVTRTTGDKAPLAAAADSPVAPLSLRLSDVTLCQPADISPRWPAAFLAGYTGYLQVDGYAGYHSTQAKLVGCMAHARRKFEEVRRAQPDAKVGKAIWALTHIQKLYRVEKACPGRPPDEIYRRRQVESRSTAEGVSGQSHRLLSETVAEADALAGGWTAQHRQ